MFKCEICKGLQIVTSNDYTAFTNRAKLLRSFITVL